MPADSLPEVRIFTDGACSGNPGPGGYAAILIYKNYKKEIYGWCSNTTNNRMELLAAIRGIEALKKRCRVVLYTDSSYLKDGMTTWIKNWIQKGRLSDSKKGVKNKDLWRLLLELNKKHDMTYKWVRGHSGDKMNERADTLARMAIKKGQDGQLKEDQAGLLQQ